jgi:hypothetical protein
MLVIRAEGIVMEDETTVKKDYYRSGTGVQPPSCQQ